MRLVLDTCVVVAAVKSRMGASHVLVDLASRGKITAVLTGPFVAEYEDVLHRPENRVEGWSEDDLYASLLT